MDGIIKWEISHDSYCSSIFMLVGDYNGHRFVRTVLDKFWGIPLMYAKWCITRRFTILYPEQFKKETL
jgi:hypothetical protein